MSTTLEGSPWPMEQEPPQKGDAADHGGDLAQALDVWIRETLRRLRERAELVQHHFESALREAGQGRPRSAWGWIAVRIRDQRAERATPGAFSIEWVTYHYANAPGGKIYVSEYLRKGEGDRYPNSAFLGVAKQWQRPIIQEAEAQFARIRKAARGVAQVRTQYRAATKVLADMQTEGEEG